MKNKNTITRNLKKPKLLFFYTVIIVLIAIIPLIVNEKQINLKGISLLYWDGSDTVIDNFNYWKALFLVFCSTILAVLNVVNYKHYSYNIRELKKYLIPLTIYICFVILSTCFCYNKNIALFGFVDMYQGVFVLISYCVICISFMFMLNIGRDINIIKNSFIFLLIIEGVICFSQFVGKDVFGGLLSKGTMYGTMFNSNFLGSFSALSIPLSISFFITSKLKISKITSFIAIISSLCIWIGCNSRAGYIAIISISLLSVILLKEEIKKNYKLVVTLILVVTIIIIVFNFISNGRTLNQFSKLNIVQENKNIKASNDGPSNLIFENIVLDNNQFSIITNQEILTVKYINEEMKFFDSKNNELLVELKDNKVVFLDNVFSNYNITISPENKALGIRINNLGTIFYFTDQGAKILGSGNRLTEPVVAEEFSLLKGYGRFASGRGYIWSRSIMLLPDTLLLGYGPDNYCISFPQDDFVAKLNSGMDAYHIIDKPHNMYLQIAINTGVFSLLSLITLWGIYIITSFKLYRGIIYDSIEKNVGFGCFMAVFGYLVAGIFNDQMVSVAPLFWIILGIGISINEKLIQKKLIC